MANNMDGIIYAGMIDLLDNRSVNAFLDWLPTPRGQLFLLQWIDLARPQYPDLDFLPLYLGRIRRAQAIPIVLWPSIVEMYAIARHRGIYVPVEMATGFVEGLAIPCANRTRGVRRPVPTAPPAPPAPPAPVPLAENDAPEKGSGSCNDAED